MLIQLSTLTDSFVVDCLSGRKHALALNAIFESEEILKVFHGCSSDLKALLTNFEIRVNNMFDTAEAFMFFENFMFGKTKNHKSLKLLSYLFLGIEVEKGYQTGDYRLRPLTRNMLEYALNDAKLAIHLFFVMFGIFRNEGLEVEVRSGIFERIGQKISSRMLESSCKEKLEKGLILSKCFEESIEVLIKAETKNIMLVEVNTT